MQTYEIEINKAISAEEVIVAREEAMTDENLLLWGKCLQQALCVICARDGNGQVVGIGFLVGNQRHGQIVDLVIHSAARQHGIGGKIFDALVSYAKTLRIPYLGLTYDKRNPWLKGFYEGHGFQTVDFAMWEKDCLAAIDRDVQSNTPRRSDGNLNDAMMRRNIHRPKK